MSLKLYQSLTIKDVGDVDLENAASQLSCLIQDNMPQLSRAIFGLILSRVSFLLLIDETWALLLMRLYFALQVLIWIRIV